MSRFKKILKITTVTFFISSIILFLAYHTGYFDDYLYGAENSYSEIDTVDSLKKVESHLIMSSSKSGVVIPSNKTQYVDEDKENMKEEETETDLLMPSSKSMYIPKNKKTIKDTSTKNDDTDFKIMGSSKSARMIMLPKDTSKK